MGIHLILRRIVLAASTNKKILGRGMLCESRHEMHVFLESLEGSLAFGCLFELLSYLQNFKNGRSRSLSLDIKEFNVASLPFMY